MLLFYHFLRVINKNFALSETITSRADLLIIKAIVAFIYSKTNILKIANNPEYRFHSCCVFVHKMLTTLAWLAATY